MKIKLLLVTAAIAIAGAGFAKAQTNSNMGQSGSSALPANVPAAHSAGADVWQVAKDFAGFFRDNTNLFNSGTAVVEAGGLYNGGKYGGFLDVQFPVESQLSIGFAAAYLDKQFYDGALSARLGTTWQVPILGPVYSFVETGPGYNVSKHEVIAQSFAGGLWKHQFTDKWAIQLGGAVGNISDRPGAVIAASLGLTFKFK